MNSAAANLCDLPREVLLEVFRHLSTEDLLRGVMPACREFYWLVRSEVERGRAVSDLKFDVRDRCLDEEDDVSGILSKFAPSARSLELVGYEAKPMGPARIVSEAAEIAGRVGEFILRDCDASMVRMKGDRFRFGMTSLQIIVRN